MHCFVGFGGHCQVKLPILGNTFDHFCGHFRLYETRHFRPCRSCFLISVPNQGHAFIRCPKAFPTIGPVWPSIGPKSLNKLQNKGFQVSTKNVLGAHLQGFAFLGVCEARSQNTFKIPKHWKWIFFLQPMIEKNLFWNDGKIGISVFSGEILEIFCLNNRRKCAIQIGVWLEYISVLQKSAFLNKQSCKWECRIFDKSYFKLNGLFRKHPVFPRPFFCHCEPGAGVIGSLPSQAAILSRFSAIVSPKCFVFWGFSHCQVKLLFFKFCVAFASPKRIVFWALPSQTAIFSVSPKCIVF